MRASKIYLDPPSGRTVNSNKSYNINDFMDISEKICQI